MKIIVDTREQKPLPFKVAGIITEIKREALSVGDYMVEFEDGYRPKTTIERKSKADLYGTLSKGYTRFKKELQRADNQEVHIIILVESSLAKVAEGFVRSKRHPESLVQQIFTMEVNYGRRFVFVPSRVSAVYWVTHYFMALGRKHKDECKKLGKG